MLKIVLNKNAQIIIFFIFDKYAITYLKILRNPKVMTEIGF